MSKTGDSQYSL